MSSRYSGHYHVQPAWISVDLPNGTSVYYRLRPNGAFESRGRDGTPRPHHIQLAKPDANGNSESFGESIARRFDREIGSSADELS
jgi:hypothetical protein